MFQKLVQWLFKNPGKQIIVKSGQRISSVLAKQRMDAWMRLMRTNNISTREVIIFQNLDKATKKAFSNEIISGTSPSKLLQKFRWLTSTPLERGLKKHPEMQKWWDSLPIADRQAWQSSINSKQLPFEQLKRHYIYNSRVAYYETDVLRYIFDPHTSNIHNRNIIANDIAKQQGLSLKKYFSGGNQGIAAETSDGRILKLTKNPDEVAAALAARGKTGNKHLVISSVRPLRFNGNTSEWYVLNMNKVTTLTPVEQTFWRPYYNKFLNPNTIKKEFVATIKQDADRLPDPSQKQEFLDFWNRFIPQRDRIVSDFKKMNIATYEAHPGNVGFDQYGQFKHFDFWVPGNQSKVQSRAYRNKPINIDLTKLGIDLSKININI